MIDFSRLIFFVALTPSHQQQQRQSINHSKTDSKSTPCNRSYWHLKHVLKIVFIILYSSIVPQAPL